MRLSVVVPVLDVADTLPAQLTALVAQGADADWEVIIADNGSTDGTLEIARECAATYDRVRVVTGAAVRSVGAARNLGIRASTAEAVAFCDGDDVVAEGFVQAVIDGLAVHDGVTGPLDYGPLNPEWLRGVRGAANVDALPGFDDLFPFMNGANLAVRRSVVDDIGLFDERRGAEDIEFAFRMHRAGYDVGFVEAMSVAYRLRQSLGDTWRQAWFYGAGRRGLRRCVRSKGLAARGPKLRNWAWLVRRLGSIATRAGRYRWVWVAGSLLGESVGRAELTGCDGAPVVHEPSAGRR